MKRKTPTPKIGIEIEVNHMTDDLEESINYDIWNTKSEHCGHELISRPAEGASQIRKLTKSIKKMGKGCKTSPGFKNAGTHIHIDFLTNSNVSANDLIRMSAKKMANGSYDNPTKNGKKFFWITPEGSIWAKPSDYMYQFGSTKSDTTASVFSSKIHTKILENVKRFTALGIRFAPVLFALQHPDRRFNKYCHSIESWNEDLLMKQPSIRAIAFHPNLQQNHRRMMFNLLSFTKFGTIEIRMIKASLDWKDIKNQISLFVRMAALAKSSDPLPSVGKTISQSFLNLINACDIHGKTRRNLIKTFDRNMETKEFTCICYHYACQRELSSTRYADLGLSRGVCDNCIQSRHCCMCGGNYYSAHRISDGRYVCNTCCPSLKAFKMKEETLQGKYHFGIMIGSGLDKKGMPMTLKRAHELFS